jgi:putative hydrolase of the HAD superfamily
MLEAITFDLWSTLVEPVDYSSMRVDHLGEILVSKGFSVEHDAILSSYAFALERFCAVWREKQRHMTAEERVTLMLAKLKINLAADEVNAIADYFERTVLNDPPPLLADAQMVLRSLHASYKIGLICDSGMSPGRVMRSVLAQHGILRYFNATVFSDEVGFTKPHSSVYQTALRQLGVVAHQALHVGDLLETDILGARAVGMRTVWLNPQKTHGPDRKVVPDYEICRLASLLSVIARERSVA